MKIGLVCPYNIANPGGVQEIVIALRKDLVARGHQAVIITPRPRDSSGCDMEGIICLGNGVDLRSPLHTTPQISIGAETDEIDEMLRKEKFDILHFHEPWVPQISRQILRLSTCVNIATFHAKVPETLMSRSVIRMVTPYTKSVLKYLHELTAVSDAAAEYVRGLTDHTVKIIPNGIDLSEYRPATRSKSHAGVKKTILYIGRLEERKGLKYLFRAYKDLSEKHPGLSLKIVGDGLDREKLEALAARMELKNCEFKGRVTDKDKLKCLNDADLFCSPAVFGESFGIVLLEAMASGLVTVAGRNSGYSSVLKDLGAISLVDPKNTEEFVQRLELLLYQEDLRRLWRTWGLKYVKQFDYKQVVDQYERVYVDALSKKH